MLQETMHLSWVRPVKVPNTAAVSVTLHNLVLLQVSFGVIDDMFVSLLDSRRV